MFLACLLFNYEDNKHIALEKYLYLQIDVSIEFIKNVFFFMSFNLYINLLSILKTTKFNIIISLILEDLN